MSPARVEQTRFLLSKRVRPGARQRFSAPVRASARNGQRLIAVVLGLLLVGLTACGNDKKPRPRGLLDAEGRPVQAHLDQRASNTPEPPTEQETQDPSAPAALPSPFDDDEEQAAQQAEKAAEEEQAERDLAAEVAGVLGQPVNCLELDKVAAGSGRLTIGVRATVSPSGRISRASVSAPGQSSQALRCIEQRMLAGRIAGPVQGAPLSVSAESVIEAVRQGPAPTPATSRVVAPQASSAELAQPAAAAELAKPAEDVVFAQPAE